MTRKDYVALAEALSLTEPSKSVDSQGVITPQWHVWLVTVDSIANTLAADNPRFDRDRFLKACQGERL